MTEELDGVAAGLDQRSTYALLRTILAVLAVLVIFAERADAGDGVQFSRDCNRTYVNKQVGASEQWAISWDLYGNATGNVFKLDGSPPSFVECQQVSDDDQNEYFDCYGASACTSPPCSGPQWTLIGSNLAIPLAFFFPPNVDPLDPFDQCIPVD